LPFAVAIVDDEPLARELVHHLLARDPDVVVAVECSGVDAAAAIARTRPDIVFLDVQMPEVDGFAVLERVGVDDAPVVVFVTAYGDHALRAFDVHALDYVLKPIDDARFATALERAKRHALARRAGEPDARLAAMLRDGSRWTKRFLVRTRDRLLVVPTETIDWIEAADYYATLHAGGASHLLSETMMELERRLDPDRFVRVHRSAIVNLERVCEVRPLFRGDAVLVLVGGAEVRLSRARRREFERRFVPDERG